MEPIDSNHISCPKTVPLIAPQLPPRPRTWQLTISSYLRKWSYTCILLVAALYIAPLLQALLQGYFRGSRFYHGQQNEPISETTDSWIEWLDITPSEELRWQPCPGFYNANHQCARLTVPMDYHRPLNESAGNPKVHLALIMIPGANRTEDPATYAEAPILVNPGGPGGSGVWFAELTGPSLQQLVGNQHDIIGFDPRGVGASTPKADCFVSPDDPSGIPGRNIAYANRLLWLTSGHDVGLTNSSSIALSKLDARARALAKLCQRVDESQTDHSIFRYSSTPNVARDMVSIINAWDEWRSQTAQPIQQPELPHPSHEPQTLDYDTDTGMKGSLRGKLVYWGFSYGTLLGATFASMFPDKVGRIILDGVVHADYYVNPMWMSSIVDADAIWERFFVYCAEAGSACKLYRTGDRPEDIKKRFNELMSLLEEHPAVVLPRDANIPALVTASDVKKTIFFAGLYAPISGFPLVAQTLNLILEDKLGDATAVGAGLLSLCGNITMPIWFDDALKVIACSDKRYKLDENVAELQHRFEEMASASWFADVWFGTDSNLGCSGWGIESKDPPMRWDDHPAHKPTPIETSFPILFLSNTLDPVTPLSHALDMTRKFANASFVEQDGAGHCSLSCISTCTLTHIRAYLNDGIVPPEPKFNSDFGNDGQWPTCTCYEKPWTIHDFTGTKETVDGRDQITSSDLKAFEELRSQFTAFTLHQQLEYDNQLMTQLVTNSKLPIPVCCRKN
ncbi:alpha/beta-hydrolase [Xylariaceae sp. FL1651]|nr:alpha/beta-hydrolase [Xylariaceae sp. FL1651]